MRAPRSGERGVSSIISAVYSAASAIRVATV